MDNVYLICSNSYYLLEEELKNILKDNYEALGTQLKLAENNMSTLIYSSQMPEFYGGKALEYIMVNMWLWVLLYLLKRRK